MVDMVTINLRKISEKMMELVPVITEEWLKVISETMDTSFTIPYEMAQQRSVIIARSLVSDVEIELQAWAKNVGCYYRSKQLPLSTLLRVSQLYRNVFWSVVRPVLPQGMLSREKLYTLKRRIGENMDRGLSWSVYFYEQQVNQELSKKEETINLLHTDRLAILDKLAASMAHELRNPLCAIEGFLKLIRETTKGQPEVEHYVDVIMHEFNTLHRQISGFLSFSRKPILDEVFKIVDFQSLLKDVELLIMPRCKAENISFERDVEPCQLYCYEDGLKQALVHLFHNAADALQRTKEKRIAITAKAENQTLYITVENNGEPIPSNLFEMLYQPFFSTKDNSPGIGLSICKNIIDKHNGTICCESKPDLTKFLITIPLQQNQMNSSFSPA